MQKQVQRTSDQEITQKRTRIKRQSEETMPKKEVFEARLH